MCDANGWKENCSFSLRRVWDAFIGAGRQAGSGCVVSHKSGTTSVLLTR